MSDKTQTSRSHRSRSERPAVNARTQWQIAFAQWRTYCDEISARAKLITEARHETGWNLAASVGIPHDMCCLHNASIDDNMKGWCFENPTRLAAAKLANAIVNDWRASRVADRMIQAKWNDLLGALGAAKHVESLIRSRSKMPALFDK